MVKLRNVLEFAGKGTMERAISVKLRKKEMKSAQ